jgi:hypothetical protein
MKNIFFILFLISNLTFGQTKGKIRLGKNIVLNWEIQNFDKTKHTFEYCLKSELKYLCKIDNQEWFGSDNGIEFPKNQLTKLNLKIGTQNYDLETSKMFNPNFSDYLSGHQFKLVTNKNYKILYSFYSDGAGTYTAHWKIENGKAERIILSKHEEYFEWQTE